jgi:DDE domain
MMAERELELAHTTIMRWVQRYVPEFEKSWARYARKVGRSWRVDETYLKVRGRWVYLYRAVDKEGNSRLPAESKERRCGGQGILPQGAPHSRACSHRHRYGWLCCIASSSARDAERKRAMEGHQAAPAIWNTLLAV